ncbi:MAG: molybdopterin converting factor subunit 1 [Pseudomonadota bacterium]
MSANIVYFAWVRERIGTGRETIDLTATTVRDLLADLAGRSDGHSAALADMTQVRVAVDQVLVDLDHPLDQPREIAIFPPMTGG